MSLKVFLSKVVLPARLRPTIVLNWATSAEACFMLCNLGCSAVKLHTPIFNYRNLCYRNPGYVVAQIYIISQLSKHTVRVANIAEDIECIPLGYNTKIGSELLEK